MGLKTKLTNFIAIMICVDLTATNIVQRVGFKNVLKIADPRYNVPSASTFPRSIILKLKKNVVNSFLMEKMKVLTK